MIYACARCVRAHAHERFGLQRSRGRGRHGAANPMTSAAVCWRCARHVRVFTLRRAAWGQCRAGYQMVALAVRLYSCKPPSMEGAPEACM